IREPMRGSALSNRWRRSNQSLRRRIGWPLLLALLLSPLLLNQLSLIFTILALTQSAGISFLQGLQSV
ncbi:hypothetical protein ACTXQV_82885, partial [Klebsiella pneumoniae]